MNDKTHNMIKHLKENNLKDKTMDWLKRLNLKDNKKPLLIGAVSAVSLIGAGVAYHFARKK